MATPLPASLSHPNNDFPALPSLSPSLLPQALDFVGHLSKECCEGVSPSLQVDVILDKFLYVYRRCANEGRELTPNLGFVHRPAAGAAHVRAGQMLKTSLTQSVLRHSVLNNRSREVELACNRVLCRRPRSTRANDGHSSLTLNDACFVAS